MDTRPYDALLIDLDNTVLDFAACEREILHGIARDFGFMPQTRDGEEITRAYRRINGALWQALERGEISGAELRIERYRQLAAELDFSALARPIEPWFLNDRFIERLRLCARFVPTADAVLRRLAKTIPVYAITNGFPDVQYPRLERAGIDTLFTGIFISEEIGAAKPQRPFFDHVMERANLSDPRRCLVVGDSLSSDIAGGNAMGMDTVWFDRSEMTGEARRPSTITPTLRITRLPLLYDVVARGATAVGSSAAP